MSLAQPAEFFSALRSGLLGPYLQTPEVQGCNAILTALEGLPLAQAAYPLATAYHETAHTLQPVKEIGGDAYFTRMYDITGNRPDKARELGNLKPGDGARFPGMGYAQATGRANARRATVKLRAAGFDVDLEQTPDLLMRPDIAAFVLRHGMEEGWFTGKKLSDFLPRDKPANPGQFMNARRIINGSDKAELIAGYAAQFQDALTAGGWC